MTYDEIAAEQFAKRAEEALACGNTQKAQQHYKNAALYFRKAASAVPEKKTEYTSLAEKCERLSTDGALQATSPMKMSKKAPTAAKMAPKAAPTSSDSQDSDDDLQEENHNGKYEGYELDIATELEEVRFDDIIGLERAKSEIFDKLIYPLRHPEAYARYNLQAGGHILLEGPPGTGKTTFAKAVAFEAKYPFVAIVSPTLVDSYIGNTAKNIKNLFEEARRFMREQNLPLVLFLDEIDAIARKRGDDKTANEAVPILLQEMEGFATDNAGLVLIAATNEKKSLDPAVLSRFDSIFIGLPNLEAREHLWRSKLKSLMEEDASKIDFQELAELSEGFNGRDITHIAKAFCNKLAQRDSGIHALEEEHMDVLRKLIEQKIQ